MSAILKKIALIIEEASEGEHRLKHNHVVSSMAH